MGFIVGYIGFVLPNLLIHIFTPLFLIRNLISSLLRFLHLTYFLEPDPSYSTRPEFHLEPHSLSAVLIRELLPVTKFSGSELTDPPDNCIICLHEFEGGDHIRQLPNCRHIFHSSCVDRWIDHDQWRCPLCRTRLVPRDLNDTFNERLRAATGIFGFYHEY